MSILKTIIAGESLTIVLIYPETYDVARIKSQKLYIGYNAFTPQLFQGTYRVEVKSNQTGNFIGKLPVALWLDDTQFGLRKPVLFDLLFVDSKAQLNTESTNHGADIVVPLTINETVIGIDHPLFDYFRSFSPYEVAVAGGYQGTEEEFNQQLGSFQALYDGAVEAKQIAEEKAGEAAQAVVDARAAADASKLAHAGSEAARLLAVAAKELAEAAASFAGQKAFDSDLSAQVSEAARLLTVAAKDLAEAAASTAGQKAIDSDLSAQASEAARLLTVAAKDLAEAAASTAGQKAIDSDLSAQASEAARLLSVAAKDLAEAAASTAGQKAIDSDLSAQASEAARLLSVAAKDLAEAARDKAQKWAEETKNVPVETGKFSAKHWAETAADTLASKENTANKQNSLAADGTGVKFPTVDAINADARKFLPLLTYSNRITADSGVVHNLEHAHREYVALLQLLNLSMVQGWSGVGGYKLNGNNASKLYDMTGNNADMSQATAGNQAFVGGRIAPNESAYLKFVTGQTGTTIGLTGSAINFAAGASWTVEMGLKTNKLSGRIYLSATDYILITSTAIRLVSAGGTTLTAPYVSRVGLIKHIEFQYSNGAGLIKVNNIPLATTTTSQATIFGSLYCNQTSFNFDGEIHYLYILNQRISEAASDALFKHIRNRLTTIQGVAVGNQFWASSNFEGVVAGNGTVIPEVQSSTDVEKIVNGGMESISEYTAHLGAILSQVEANRPGGSGTYSLRTSVTGLNQGARQKNKLIANRTYLVTGWVRSDGNQVPRVWVGGNDNHHWQGTSSTEWQYFNFFQIANDTELYLTSGNSTTGFLEWDDVSFIELGWSSATTAYNGVIAQGGTVYQALQASAMWCYYNNNPENGLIYGKLYNWYAVALFALFPPQGMRVPTSAEFTQLQTYLGGAAVAGGRMKATGLTYWNTPNAGVTNDSGFAAVGAGRRAVDGAFGIILSETQLWTSTSASADDANYWSMSNGIANLNNSNLSKIRGKSLRLLLTAPAGANELPISVTSTSNHASTALSIPIPFGYVVEAIRITNRQAATNLTGISATHNNTAGTSLGTLITGKTVNATESILFTAAQFDMPTQRTDGTVRVICTGNGGAGMEVTVILRKQAL